MIALGWGWIGPAWIARCHTWRRLSMDTWTPRWGVAAYWSSSSGWSVYAYLGRRGALRLTP